MSVEKALIVGTGGIGQRHAQNLKALVPDLRLMCVRDAPSAVTDELEIACLPDIEAAMGEMPDLAVIALPPALQPPVAARLLEANVPLYLEKPAALTPDPLQRIVDAAEARGVPTMMGCQLRRLPGIRRMRKILLDGELGRPITAHFSVGQWLPDWRPGRDYREVYSACRALGGGVILDLVHEIDLALYLLDDLTLETARAGYSGTLDIETEDYADIWLRSKTDTHVSIHLDYLDRGGHRRGRIVGSEGTLEWDVIRGQCVFATTTKDGWQNLAEPDAFDTKAALRTAMSDFVDCVEEGRPSDQPISEGLRVIALADAARQAAGIVT